jgi:hypothetical protein
MDILGNLWKSKCSNQASHIAIPIGKQDHIRPQLRIPIEKKPSGYKNLNTSQIKIITDRNLTDM